MFILMKTNIAANIKYYRTQLGLTQGELAEKLCGKKSLVSNYENGYGVATSVGHTRTDCFRLYLR